MPAPSRLSKFGDGRCSILLMMFFHRVVVFSQIHNSQWFHFRQYTGCRLNFGILYLGGADGNNKHPCQADDGAKPHAKVITSPRKRTPIATVKSVPIMPKGEMKLASYF